MSCLFGGASVYELPLCPPNTVCAALSVRSSHSQRLLAVLTARAIYILAHSGVSSAVCIGGYHSGNSAQFNDCEWSTDDAFVGAATSDTLFVVRVVVSVADDGAATTANCSLHTRIRLSNDRICCLLSLNADWILGTARGYIQSVSSDGDPLHCHAHADGEVAVVSADAAAALGWIALVSDDGTASVIDSRCIRRSLPRFPLARLVSANTQRRALLCRISVQSATVAIGYDDAAVIVFVPAHNGNVTTFTARHVLHPMTLTSAHIGAVTALDWSADGQCVAVGWQHGGVAIFSSDSTLLAHTFKQTHAHTTAHNSHVVEAAVRAIAFAAFDYAIFVVQQSSEEHVTARLISLPLIQIGTHSSSSAHSNTSLLLIGADRLLIWNGLVNADGVGGVDGDDAGDVTDTSQSDWESVAIPPSSYHPRLTAVSVSGAHIAVSNGRGLALFSRVTGRWRSFGNVHYEQTNIRPTALQWYGESVVAVLNRVQANSARGHGGQSSAGALTSKSPSMSRLRIVAPIAVSLNAPSDTTYHAVPPTESVRQHAPHPPPHPPSAPNKFAYEILFFPRSHLDESSLLHRHVFEFGCQVDHIDIDRHTLMVTLSTGVILFYRLIARIHEETAVEEAAPLHRSQSLPSAPMDIAPVSPSSALSSSSTSSVSSSSRAYRTSVRSSDSVNAENRISMTVTFIYAVDVSEYYRHAHTADQSVSPFKSTRLWLRSADALEDYQETIMRERNRKQSTDAPPSPAVDVVELPVYASDDAHTAPALTAPSSPLTLSSSAHSLSKVISLVLLTTDGRLVVGDIGPRIARRGNTTEVDFVFWLREVSGDVSSFWLHQQYADELSHGAVDAMTDSLQPILATQTMRANDETRQNTSRLYTNGAVDGLSVWFRLTVDVADSYAPPPFLRTNIVEFDNDVTWLSFDNPRGAVIGITPFTHVAMANDIGAPLIDFAFRTKLSPYLHAVLYALLTAPPHRADDHLATAIRIATECRSQSLFRESLELLLHKSLMETAETLRRTHRRDVASLSKVIHFLSLFTFFPALLAHSARKHDASYWSLLFAHSGPPLALFLHSRSAGDYRTAALYLILIQRTAGVRVARRHAKRLIADVIALIDKKRSANDQSNRKPAETADATTFSATSVSALVALRTQLKRFIHFTQEIIKETQENAAAAQHNGDGSVRSMYDSDVSNAANHNGTDDVMASPSSFGIVPSALSIWWSDMITPRNSTMLDVTTAIPTRSKSTGTPTHAHDKVQMFVQRTQQTHTRAKSVSELPSAPAAPDKKQTLKQHEQPLPLETNNGRAHHANAVEMNDPNKCSVS